MINGWSKIQMVDSLVSLLKAPSESSQIKRSQEPLGLPRMHGCNKGSGLNYILFRSGPVQSDPVRVMQFFAVQQHSGAQHSQANQQDQETSS
jgi:hypothetical protein